MGDEDEFIVSLDDLLRGQPLMQEVTELIDIKGRTSELCWIAEDVDIGIIECLVFSH